MLALCHRLKQGWSWIKVKQQQVGCGLVVMEAAESRDGGEEIAGEQGAKFAGRHQVEGERLRGVGGIGGGGQAASG